MSLELGRVSPERPRNREESCMVLFWTLANLDI
jgi:hypothetical protein